MAVTGTKTVRDIVTRALRKATLVGWGETPPPEDAEEAREELESMLKGWQNAKYNLWTTTSGSITLTTAGVYTLSPVRPLRIHSARFRQNSIDRPMVKITRDEYDHLPNKAATGSPVQFYYDKQRESAQFYIWPLMASVNGETIEWTGEREIEDIANLNDIIDVPGEWWDCVVYNLAARLLETAPLKNKPTSILLRAQQLLSDALAADREDSVFFGPEDGA